MNKQILSLLQHRHRVLIFFFISLFFLSGCDAGSLGVSPPSLNFNFGSSGEKCQKISIYVDRSFIEIDDFWSLGKSRDLSKYILEADEVGINITYNKGLYVNKKQEVEVCIVIEKEGLYHGVLLVSANNAVIGIWINADYNGQEIYEKDKNSVFKVNSNVIKDVFIGKEEENKNILLLLMSLFSILLNIVLLLSLLMLNKRIKQNKIV